MTRRIRPVSRILRIETEIKRSGAASGIRDNDLPGLDQTWVPAVDIYENEEEIVVEAELPGVLKKDVKIMLHGNRIEIKGLKKETLAEEGVRFHRLEKEYGTFRRVVFVPGAVQQEKTSASLENGILTIILKKQTGRGKNLEVRIRNTGE